MVKFGNSGATFTRVGDTMEKTLRIPCSAGGTPATERLITQAKKQHSFKSGGRVRSPSIQSVGCHRDGQYCVATVKMAYVEGRNPLMVEEAYADVADTLAAWVMRNYHGGVVHLFPGNVFLEKLGALRRTINDPSLDHIFDGLMVHFRDGADLTIGRTHGDLTFCNTILDGDGTIWLIDLLDPFVDCVEMDMAKLRQDTADLWITLFADIPHRRLLHADHILDLAFSQADTYRKHCDALRVFNMLRALPYATRDNVREHIYGRLRCLPSF